VVTEYQERVLSVIRAQKEAGGLWLTTDGIARRMGYCPAASGRLACWRALQSLREAGVVDGYRDRPDRWGVMQWGEV